MKKVISLFLVVFSLLSILVTGCGGTDNNTSVASADSSNKNTAVKNGTKNYGDTGDWCFLVTEKPATITWMLSGETQNDNDKPVIKPWMPRVRCSIRD